MKDSYYEIVERIQLQLSDLDRLVKRALLSWSHAKKSPDEQRLYLDAVALNLHGFYSGLERPSSIVFDDTLLYPVDWETTSPVYQDQRSDPQTLSIGGEINYEYRRDNKEKPK